MGSKDVSYPAGVSSYSSEAAHLVPVFLSDRKEHMSKLFFAISN